MRGVHLIKTDGGDKVMSASLVDPQGQKEVETVTA